MDAPEDYLDWLWEQDELDDDWEGAMMDCGIFYTDGHYYCGAVGSEQCDECPNNSQLGRKRWYTPRRKTAEEAEAAQASAELRAEIAVAERPDRLTRGRP
jgi:hypothetical protein